MLPDVYSQNTDVKVSADRVTVGSKVFHLSDAKSARINRIRTDKYLVLTSLCFPIFFMPVVIRINLMDSSLEDRMGRDLLFVLSVVSGVALLLLLFIAKRQYVYILELSNGKQLLSSLDESDIAPLAEQINRVIAINSDEREHTSKMPG